ncbi:hypothetical protein Ade02nite_62760 [Paractinoplanes deccanensis]|uniref:Uncharacterized protein n=1 Tax=Paractinoplanes deccanensis TaxID=113561 RepID=A0ABQ3YCH1_9ACTN|nr:hypothetical protein [Actinoplanes deccanensis]GID77635.1 hypothetical protein Ade02nite_62760 [Actinoplanes deccanensis]
MFAIAVPAFAFAWWAACYLLGRDPVRQPTGRAAAALMAYAVGVAVWTVAPDSTLAQVLFCAPVLLWAGSTVALLPATLPERRHIDLGWLVLAAAFLGTVIALPQAGRLVVLAPLAGGVVLLWRFRDQVRPPMLPAALTVAAVLYGVTLAVLLLPVDLGAPMLVIAALGVDLLMLAFLVAVHDAMAAGERLRPDLLRSVAGAVAAVLLVGAPAVLTVTVAESDAVTILQFGLLAVVMTFVGLPGAARRVLDAIAFRRDARLRADRSAVLMLAEALPRHRHRQQLPGVSEDDFRRFTHQALDNYGDLGRLMRSPLTDLPVIDQRLRGRLEPGTLEHRALELRVVLQEGVDRLRPAGAFDTTDAWRSYNVLHYCCVLGLDPYARRPRTDGLDRDARRALDWMRRQVPRQTMRRWQGEGAAVIAARLRADLVGGKPKWSVRSGPARADERRPG